MRGRRIRYTSAELAFVEANHAMCRRDLANLFASRFRRSDVTAEHLKGLCLRRGWTTQRKRWTSAEDALLRRLYPGTPTIQIADKLQRSVPSTWHRAKTLGLKKDEAYLNSPAAGRTQPGGDRGRVSRCQKGQTPPNKGLRRPGWHRGRMKETQFKKGQLSGTAKDKVKPIGAERLSKDGYLERKINNDLPMQARWRAVQRIRWEEVNGPQPEGTALKCLDGNKLNTDPSNWMLVPRSILPRLNGVHGLAFDQAPTDLKPTLLALAKLEDATFQRSRRPGEPTWKTSRRMAMAAKRAAAT